MKSIYLIMLGLIASIGLSFADDCTTDKNADVTGETVKDVNINDDDGNDDGNGDGDTEGQ